MAHRLGQVWTGACAMGAAACALAAACAPVSAQTSTPQPAAQPAPGPAPGPAPAPGATERDVIVVIGRVTTTGSVERAERFQARQVRDLFDGDPAIDLGGGTRNGQRLFLRGIEGSNLNITVDGARQGQNLYNHRGGLSNVDPEILKRVEIQPGPPAADQGFGALGGAVRFETIDAQDRLLPGRRVGGFARGSYASASEARRGGLAGYGLLADRVGVLGYATYTRFSDLRIGGGDRVPFSGGEDRTLLLKLSMLGQGGHDLRLGYEHNRASGLNFMQRGDYPWQLQPVDIRARPPQNQTLTRDTLTARHRFDGASPLVDVRTSAYWNRNDFFAPDSNAERFISEVLGGDVRNVFGWELAGAAAETSVGLDYARDRGTASRSDAGTRYNLNENLGLFAQQRATLGPVRLSAGVRRDDFTADYGPAAASGDAWSFNAGGEVSPLPFLTLAAGYGEATRGNGTLPIQFARNAQPGLTFNGVAGGELRPERSAQWEGSARIAGFALGDTGFALGADLVGFETRIDNAILYFQPGSGGLGGRSIRDIRNGERTIRFRGFEAGAGVASAFLASSLRYADIAVRDMPPEPQFIARTGAPRGAQFVWDTRAAFADFTLGYALRRTNRLTNVPAGQTVYIAKPGYTLHDAHVGWRPAFAPAVAVDLAVTNIGDRRYVAHSTLTQDGFATQEAGRDIRLAVSLRY